mgnify:CR=1 FL=1
MVIYAVFTPKRELWHSETNLLTAWANGELDNTRNAEIIPIDSNHKQ